MSEWAALIVLQGCPNEVWSVHRARERGPCAAGPPCAGPEGFCEPSVRIAAIDIGTNSVRCTVVEAPVGGPRKTLDDEKAYTRLGRGLTATGVLAEEAIDETIAALKRMLAIARQQQVDVVRAVATAAVREAANGARFIERARAELDLEVEVISEEEEGRLAYLSAASAIDLSGRSAVVDLGGGSLEIVRGTGRTIDFIASLPLGAVVLSERFHVEDPMPKRDRKRLRQYLRAMLAHAFDDELEPVATLVGSGGTIVTIAALIAARLDPGLTSMHTYVIRRAELVHLVAELERSTAAERRLMKGMPESRVDIICAGAFVVDEVMRAFGANELIVNARGMREGIVIDTIERAQGVVRPLDRMAAARDFARSCRADAAHAEHVRRLALELFDALVSRLRIAGDLDSARELLEAAALLHDVGYHIAYERHHKHSYHLISYAEIAGFKAREIRMVAAIARYHRGALPRDKHEAMQGLDRAQRRLVTQLAALLRFADGMDRSRGQKVQDLVIEQDGARLSIGLIGRAPLDAEVHGAQRKADLLEHVLGVRIDVHGIEAADAPLPDDRAAASRIEEEVRL